MLIQSKWQHKLYWIDFIALRCWMFETFLQNVKLHICKTSNILAVSEAEWSTEATKPITVIHMHAVRLIYIVHFLVQEVLVFLIKILFVGSYNALIIRNGMTWPKENLIIFANEMSLYLMKCKFKFRWVKYFDADPNARAVKGVGLRPLACWDCGFESHRGHGCLSVVSVCVVR